MTTVFAKADDVRSDWFVVDATGKTLGRLASELAIRLRGKHKPQYTPNADLGDHLIVLNAGKVKVTGAKLDHFDLEFLLALEMTRHTSLAHAQGSGERADRYPFEADLRSALGRLTHDCRVRAGGFGFRPAGAHRLTIDRGSHPRPSPRAADR